MSESFKEGAGEVVGFLCSHFPPSNSFFSLSSSKKKVFSCGCGVLVFLKRKRKSKCSQTIKPLGGERAGDGRGSKEQGMEEGLKRMGEEAERRERGDRGEAEEEEFRKEE